MKINKNQKLPEIGAPGKRHTARQNYKATLLVLCLVWLAIGCVFDDTDEESREAAKVIKIKGKAIETDLGLFFTANADQFKVGDDCWLVEDEDGSICICTTKEDNPCFDARPLGTSGSKPHKTSP